MASAERELITAVQGQSPWWGQGSEAPLKLKTFQTLYVEKRQQICPVLAFWQLELAYCTW